jgi:hypothetical protein
MNLTSNVHVFFLLAHLEQEPCHLTLPGRWPSFEASHATRAWRHASQLENCVLFLCEELPNILILRVQSAYFRCTLTSLVGLEYFFANLLSCVFFARLIRFRLPEP